MNLYKLREYVMYITSVLLFVFYILVLFLSFKPKVSMEYKSFYIDKELKSWGSNDSFSYTLGTPLKFYMPNEEIYSRISNGWSNLETDGCWTDGNAAKIFFKDLPNKDINISILVADMIAKGKIYFVANGNTMLSISPKDIFYNNKLEFQVPSHILLDGYLELEIIIDNPQSTPTDSRKLGIRIKEVILNG